MIYDGIVKILGSAKGTLALILSASSFWLVWTRHITETSLITILTMAMGIFSVSHTVTDIALSKKEPK